MAIKLFDFQQEALKKALSLFYMLLCVRVGGGKTLIAMAYVKNLLKKNIVDKAVFACTVSAAVAVKNEFKEKCNVTVPQFDDVEDFLGWLKGPGKMCLVKHSMFEKLGFDQNVIDEMRDVCATPGHRLALVVDEAHKIGNDTSIANSALKNIKSCFDRLLFMTATPYQSDLSQMYGLLALLNPRLWKNKAEFTRRYIEEQVIMMNGRVARKEKIAYKNLAELREKMNPFTFFYYPKIKLNFFYHNVVLKDYTEYDNICKGVLTEKELEKLNAPDKPKKGGKKKND